MRSLAYARPSRFCADLFEIDVGGVTYRLTNSDRDLVGVTPASSGTFYATTIERTRDRASDGLQVDDQDITVFHDGATGLGGQTWVALARSGALDEAPIRVYRAVLNPGAFNVAECYLQFSGTIIEANPGSTEVRMVAAVAASRFGNQAQPVTYEKNCIWNLGDAGTCGYSGTMEFSATVGSQSSLTVLHLASMPGGSNEAQFYRGVMRSAVASRTIIECVAAGGGGVGGEITSGFGFKLSPPLPVALVIGSSVTIRKGCLKFPSACHTTFSNLAHFQGAPLVPVKA